MPGHGGAWPLAQVCPGCVGRGVGTSCVVCGGEIPPELWRTLQDSAPEYRADCPACLRGARHTHEGTS